MTFWMNSIILLLANSTLKLVTTAKESDSIIKKKNDLFFSEDNLL